MSTQAPRVLLLDVMGTLVSEPFEVDVPRFFGVTLADLYGLLTPGLWVDFEKNLVDETTFLQNFFADRRAYDHHGLKTCLYHSYQFLDGIEAVLGELKAAGARMHLLSNYPRWYTLIEEKLALSRYAPWSFVSCDTGVRKPDADAYLGAASALGVRPDACVFVDDRAKNCAAARALGMRALHFENASRLRADLVKVGVLARRPTSCP